MVTIELDRRIGSPILKAKLGIQYVKAYKNIDDMIENRDWKAMEVMMRVCVDPTIQASYDKSEIIGMDAPLSIVDSSIYRRIYHSGFVLKGAAINGRLDMINILMKESELEYYHQTTYINIAEIACEHNHPCILDKTIELYNEFNMKHSRIGLFPYQSMAEIATKHGHLDMLKRLYQMQPAINMYALLEIAIENGCNFIQDWLMYGDEDIVYPPEV